MPVAFFTRTRTGALVSRLDNDVIGAQQAFTSTLSGVLSNVIGLVLTAAVMFTLSWQITLVSLLLVPLFVLAARWMGQRLAGLTREQMTMNADMGSRMTERFNVGGAMLLKLFGRREAEDAIRRAVVAAEHMGRDLRGAAERESEALIEQAQARREVVRHMQARRGEIVGRCGAPAARSPRRCRRRRRRGRSAGAS